MNATLENNDPPFHVLTTGASLAGLFLGILLERAGIPFDIYERAAEIKLHNEDRLSNTNRFFNNVRVLLGLVEELMSFSKLCSVRDGTDAYRDILVGADGAHRIAGSSASATPPKNDYKEERFDAIKEQCHQSYKNTQLIYGYRILGQFVINRLVKSIQQRQLIKDTSYRSQEHFLSLVPKCGTVEHYSSGTF
ncbi:hypothetical protein EC957_006783 [Mortierella hygrophila]|uniref:FAD-binding domain-containing protein n=1 Tax=Mortierella hygrophila TaxID=979708 RepID=A0A9P6EXR5_9FUNG|nr:hypothetical protein EC957_006783 [Mortierella hygrophila]